MNWKKSALGLGVAGVVCVLSACGGAEPSEVPALATDADLVTQAEYTDHAIVTCQSATMYGNYSASTGPASPMRSLGYGNKVGIRQNAGSASWAMVLDYGMGDWGFVLRSCMTRCAGPNNPIAGCF